MSEANLLVHISGAGPSGLAAALTLADAGVRAIVHERNGDVGARFHGDFQGLENWTTSGDVFEELSKAGIQTKFEHTPFRELIVYDPQGREHIYRSPDPIFYLVRRGPSPGTLDTCLRDQALERGVEICFHDARQQLPEGGIAADGPRGSDAIAVGYLFETDMADGAFTAISDRLAPKGYSYLLVHEGRGTVATCIFEDFHKEKTYLERTIDLFRAKVGLRMQNEKGFGGTGNFSVPPTARKGNILFAGEAAGFQDALWGFGMRYAMLSGHLAARALIEGRPEQYDGLWKERLGGLLRTSIVNRFLLERLGDGGYVRLLRAADHSEDARKWLRAQYASSLSKQLLSPIARRAIRSRRLATACPMEECDCTWCRCRRAPTSCEAILVGRS